MPPNYEVYLRSNHPVPKEGQRDTYVTSASHVTHFPKLHAGFGPLAARSLVVVVLVTCFRAATRSMHEGEPIDRDRPTADGLTDRPRDRPRDRPTDHMR